MKKLVSCHHHSTRDHMLCGNTKNSVMCNDLKIDRQYYIKALYSDLHSLLYIIINVFYNIVYYRQKLPREEKVARSRILFLLKMKPKDTRNKCRELLKGKKISRCRSWDLKSTKLNCRQKYLFSSTSKS